MDDQKPIAVEPPFYLLSTDTVCWECGQKTRVCALAVKRIREDAYDDPAVLRYVEWLPRKMRHELQGICPRFELRPSKTANTTYYTNACECGALIGDYYLMQPGEGFFPTTDEEIDGIDVKRLQYADVFSTRATGSWGVVEKILRRSTGGEAKGARNG